MLIQWYPGHMKKTRELIQEHIRLVDLVIELLDARAVRSSINPQFDDLISSKKRLIVLNKSDLSDETVNKEWIRYFEALGHDVLLFNAKTDPPKKLIDAVKRSAAFVHEKNRAKDQKLRPIRAMVIGIPNVGKSSLINRLVGKAAAKTGNKPGVTKGKQWIRLQGDIDLFDTPGILWPKFEDQQQATHLALIGSINDVILDQYQLALELLKFLGKSYPQALQRRYRTEGTDDLWEQIGRRRGALLAGGVVDEERVANLLIDDFRSGALGRISLERPDA